MITFPYIARNHAPSMPKLTLENVKKAIDFIETVDNEVFIENYQMYEFIDAEGNLKSAKHCVLGALALLPTSPFYDTTQIDSNYKYETELFVINRLTTKPHHVVNTLNFLVYEVLGTYLAKFNNGVNPEGLEGESTPKNRALTALKQTYEILSKEL